jgi:hypothetical protein
LSQDRYLTDERAGARYATCARQPHDRYVMRPKGPDWLWAGTQRDPELPDEAGAVCVIECLFDGRVRIYAIEGDKERRRVQYDAGWRREAR